jgi:hypothetical protein
LFAQRVQVGEAVFVQDAGAVQQPRVQDGQSMVDVVGDVQAGPGAEGGRVGADQGSQGGAVDDDLAALVWFAGVAGDEGGNERGVGGGVFGQVGCGGQVGVAGDLAVQFGDGLGIAAAVRYPRPARWGSRWG